MNPYASFLGDRDPVATISATPNVLAGLLRDLGPTGLETRPAPGKWSPREILCHLADCEVAFAFRIRQTLAEPHHVIQPFDQDAWAKTYADFTAAEALDLFSTLRRSDLRLIRNATMDELLKPVSHPERGAMTFQTIVETMGGHDLNHIGQLERMAAGVTRPPLAERMPKAPVLQLIGMTLLHHEMGESALTMSAQPAHANPHGTMHGGVLCDLADFAMGSAFATLLAPDETFTTLELKINFLRPVWTGRLDARGKVLAKGRTVGLVESNVYDENGKHVAHATSTCMVLRGEAAMGR